jgi:hypothetical protein
MQEQLKPIMIKPNKEDLEYLAYRRNLRKLEALGKKLRKLKSKQSKSPMEGEEKDFETQLNILREERTPIHKQVLKYLTQQRRVSRPPVTDSILGYDRSILINDFMKFNELQAYWHFIAPLLSNPTNKALWVTHDIVDNPTNLLYFEDTELSPYNGHVFFWPHEYYYPDEVGLNLSGVLYADSMWGTNCALVIHEYNLPAPLSDSTVNWQITYYVGVHNPVIEPEGRVRVVPIAGQSPDGSLPSMSDFMEYYSQFQHNAGSRKDDDETETWGCGGLIVVSGAYSVKAGVKSSIFFGIELDLLAYYDSLAKGDAFGYLTYPPGATLYDSSTPSPILPRKPGVEYKMVADSIVDHYKALGANMQMIPRYILPSP